MENTCRVQEITWDEIKPIWENELWPNKKGGVKPTNNWCLVDESLCNVWSLSEDKNIEKFAFPVFFGIRMGERYHNIVAVNSVFESNPMDDKHFRSRGLWVDPAWRGMGLSKLLLQRSERHAVLCGGELLWTVPRMSALPAYEAAGFQEIGERFDDQFGEHCVAIKEL